MTWAVLEVSTAVAGPRGGFRRSTRFSTMGKTHALAKGNPRTGRAMHSSHDPIDWHPCPKPLDAWQWLLCKGSLEGETVLDPFAGAFTTLLAAQRTGRNWQSTIEIRGILCAERGADRLSQTAFGSCRLPNPCSAQKEFVL